MVLVSLTPYGLRLRLYAAYCAECRNSSVKYAQRSLDLHGKVHVARSVYQVDLVGLSVVMPEGCGGSGSNGYTPFLLLDHPVHGSSSVMHLTYLMSFSRIVQDTLGRGSLSGIDVSHDTDISGVF